MAPVVDTFPSPDGVVRQVGLRTAGSDSVHRAVHQLVPLLPEEEERRTNAVESWVMELYLIVVIAGKLKTVHKHGLL